MIFECEKKGFYTWPTIESDKLSNSVHLVYDARDPTREDADKIFKLKHHSNHYGFLLIFYRSKLMIKFVADLIGLKSIK